MGVKVTAAATPLADDVRARMKPVGGVSTSTRGRVTPYDASTTDAAPFDSVPGPGFDVNKSAAAIVPPAGRVTGSGVALSLDPAQNNAFRALNRAWKEGATVQFTGGRYIVGNLSDARQLELVKSLALVAE